MFYNVPSLSKKGELYMYILVGPQETLSSCIFSRKILMIALFYSFKEPPLWLGVLQPNTKLRQAERLFENQLTGPESIANIGGK